MNGIKRLSLFALISLFFFSCETDTVISPGEIPEGTSFYHNINVTQTSSNSFNVSSNESFLLTSKKISKIILTNKNSGDVQSTPATYEKVGNKLRLKFNISAKLDTSVFYNNYSVKYIFIDNSFTFIDSSLPTFKYPFKTTKIFTRWDNFTNSLSKDVQDFDLVNNKIYFHPYGPLGFFEYTRGKESKLKFDYVGGDFISATENFVFCDLGHNSIYRYNIATDKTDLNIKLNSNNNITGVDTYDNKLYVSTDEGKIFIYDFDLNPIKTIPYDGSLSYLTINNNIAYSTDSKNKLIKRYDLTTEKFIDAIPYPSHDSEAIKIVDDMLFFTDYKKEIIGYFQLSDIEEL